MMLPAFIVDSIGADGIHPNYLPVGKGNRIIGLGGVATEDSSAARGNVPVAIADGETEHPMVRRHGPGRVGGSAESRAAAGWWGAPARHELEELGGQ